MSEHVKPYNSDGSKKEQITQMFDNVAPTYDFLNRFLSLGIDQRWRKIAVKHILQENPEHILDVATGTADMPIMMTKHGHTGHITGIDISENMLSYGRKKIAERKLDEQITLGIGDAENLQFPDNSMDIVSVSFGIRNFESLDRGMQEIERVLRPNGKFVVLEFSKPKVFPLKQLFNFYFKNILPIIGKIQSKDPLAYKYLYESVQAFPERKDFENRLRMNGFEPTLTKSLTAGICHLYIAQKRP